jgi:hypothetical protein
MGQGHKIMVGKNLVERHLAGAQRNGSPLYTCHTVGEIRLLLDTLTLRQIRGEEITVYLPEPTPQQWAPFLKFMEETDLQLVFLLPHDCVPGPILSRCMSFEKNEEVRFRHPVSRLPMSDRVRARVYRLLGIEGDR